MGKRFFILIFNCINYIGINNNYYFTKMSENQDITQKESSIQNQQIQQQQEQTNLQKNDMIIDNKPLYRNLKKDPLSIAVEDLQSYVNYLKDKKIDVTDLNCPEDFLKNLRTKQKKVKEYSKSRSEWAEHLKSTGIDLNNNKLLEMATSNHLPQNNEEEHFNCFVAANQKLYEKKQIELNESQLKIENLQKQLTEINNNNNTTKKRKIDELNEEEENKKKVKPNPEKNNNGSQIISFRTVSKPEDIKDQRSAAQWLKNLVDKYNYEPKYKVQNEDDIKYHQKIINCDIGKNNTFPSNFKGLPFTS